MAMNPMNMNQAQRNELERLNPPPTHPAMRMNASNSSRVNGQQDICGKNRKTNIPEWARNPKQYCRKFQLNERNFGA